MGSLKELKQIMRSDNDLSRSRKQIVLPSKFQAAPPQRRFRELVEDSPIRERPQVWVYFVDEKLSPLVYTKQGFKPVLANTIYQGRLDYALLTKGDLIYDESNQVWVVQDKVHKLSDNPRQPSKLFFVIQEKVTEKT